MILNFAYNECKQAILIYTGWNRTTSKRKQALNAPIVDIL